MKYIQNYHDYLRENKQFINPQNSEEMNEGIKHWLATFLMLVSLGIVPPDVMSASEKTKMEFVQDTETIEKVASKFEAYYMKNNFYNTAEYAWEDFQKVYGNCTYSLKDVLKNTSMKRSLFSSPQMNTKIPTPTNYVNDYAELIYPQEKEDSLNAKLSRYEKQSGMEIAIVTVNKFDEETEIDGFAHKVFNTWHVGKSASNNGILIAICEKDKKYRIETGYGAEIVLPDLACDDLAQSILVPAFKAGNYEEGIEKLVDGMMKKIGTSSTDIKAFQDQYKAKKEQHMAQVKAGLLTAVEIIGLLAVMGLLIGLAVKKYKKDKELRDRCKGLLADIKILIKQFEDESANPKDLDYLKNLKVEFENYISEIDLPNKPTTNQEVIDKLFQYNKKLGELIEKAEKYMSQMMLLYQQMTQSLAMTDAREGQDT